MVVAKQPAMPVIVPAAAIMLIGGVVMRMVMPAVMARIRPTGGRAVVRMVALRVVVAGAGRAVRGWGSGVVMGVVMAIRAMVVLAFAHGALSPY